MPRTRNRWEVMRSESQRCSEKFADLTRRLESNRGKERDESSVKREVSGIIHKDFKAIIGYKIGEIPEGKKKPSLTYWIKDKELERYEGFGKMIVFTDKGKWHSEKVVKVYNQKSLVEDDSKLLSDAFLVPIGPVNHHKDANIRVHTFLCITGLLFYRYLAYRCNTFHISLKRLVRELDGIRIALAKDSAGGLGLGLVVEEMNSTQARLFSHLNLGKFIAG